MPGHSLESCRTFAERLATLACSTVREQLDGMQLTIKSDGSPVTSVDLAVEQVLRNEIDDHFPEHGVLGEEHGSRDLDAEWIWVLDPIDGTRQFAAGLPNYGVLIALCRAGRPVLGVICQPLLNDVYVGAIGLGTRLNGRAVAPRHTTEVSAAIASLSDPDAYDSRTLAGFTALRRASKWNVYDGGCLGFGALAAGKLDISVCGPNLENFDICALVPVVEAAGGVITDWRGNELTLASEGEIVASSTPALHEAVLELLATT